METPREKHFEDFVPQDGRSDLLAKVTALDRYLADANEPCLEGLGVALCGPAAHRVRTREADGSERESIMLGSNSYLALTTRPEVVAASRQACADYGYGMGAVALYGGITPLHRAVEELLAQIYDVEDALLFPCGYSANVGILSALCGPGDIIVNDAANHASIFDGCRLSGAEIRVYLHRNMAHLERTLRRLPENARGRLIVTDGVFSMDGDLAPLDRIVELAGQYGARVMVDDAHGLGVVGPTGRGTAEHFGCLRRIDLHCGVLSKAPGAIGGYCAASAPLIQYLRYYARTYFFSTSMPAPVAAGLEQVLRLIRDDRAGRPELWRNIVYLKEGLQRLGFHTGRSESAIIPIIVGDEPRLAKFHAALRKRGLLTNLVTYPAVRRKECRLRVNVMRTLTTDDMDRALEIFAQEGRTHGVLS